MTPDEVYDYPSSARGAVTQEQEQVERKAEAGDSLVPPLCCQKVTAEQFQDWLGDLSDSQPRADAVNVSKRLLHFFITWRLTSGSTVSEVGYLSCHSNGLHALIRHMLIV